PASPRTTSTRLCPPRTPSSRPSSVAHSLRRPRRRGAGSLLDIPAARRTHRVAVSHGDLLALARARVAPPGQADWGHDWGRTRTRRAGRSGSVAVMNTTEAVRPLSTGHAEPLEVGAELVEETG